MLAGITRQLGNEEFLFSCVIHQSYWVRLCARVLGGRERTIFVGEGDYLPGVECRVRNLPFWVDSVAAAESFREPGERESRARESTHSSQHSRGQSPHPVLYRTK